MSIVQGSPLLIRADAGAEIGTGHVMRCLALAQAWQDAGGDALFASASMPAALAERLQQEGMSVAPLQAEPGSREDARQVATLAAQAGAAWAVADGYHIGAEYQRVVKDAGLRLLFVDDWGHAGHYCADLVLNQNLHAVESLYHDREPGTQLLLGTRYALLRREFWRWRGWQRPIADVAHKVLVTMGGSDPDNVTLKVIQASLSIDDLQATVVVGAGNSHYAELAGAAGESAAAIRLVRNVGNMPELMAWADVAVSAGGSTCWELAMLGTPSLLVVLADNQEPLASRLAEIGAAVNLGRHEALSPGDISLALAQVAAAPETRAEMARCGRACVDGDGAPRVVRRMCAYELHLRPAQPSDCRLLWEWANDPDTRAASFDSDPIPWARHVEWFAARLADPDSLLYVAVNAGGEPVGQIRFQIQGRKSVVSIAVAPDERGRGYGSEFIRLGAEAVFAGERVDVIHAYIKPENSTSVHAFRAAGFADDGRCRVGGFSARRFVLHVEKCNG